MVSELMMDAVITSWPEEEYTVFYQEWIGLILFYIISAEEKCKFLHGILHVLVGPTVPSE